MDALSIILRDMNRCPRQKPVAVRAIPNLEKVMAGEWSANDLLECMVDEVSTAAAAGSGADRPLGVSVKPVALQPEDEEETKKFNEAIRGVRKFLEANPMHAGDLDLIVHLYLEQSMPGNYTKELRKRLVCMLRKEGY